MSALTLLHTSPIHVATFEALAAEAGKPVRLTHVVREDLLAPAIAEGALPEAVQSEAVALMRDLAASGPVLCTCSTLGPAADAAREGAGFPVFRIDRPMAQAAVAAGRRIAVLATLPCTLPPSTALVVEAGQGSGVVASPMLVEGAWEETAAGDGPRAADLIRAAALEAAGTHDVLVLAQASMAAALEGTDLTVPVFTSPRSGFGAAVALLGTG